MFRIHLKKIKRPIVAFTVTTCLFSSFSALSINAEPAIYSDADGGTKTTIGTSYQTFERNTDDAAAESAAEDAKNDSFGAAESGENIPPAINTTVKSNSVILKINDETLTVNGKTITMDVAPYLHDNEDGSASAMIPLRWAAEAMGIKEENVRWSSEDRSVTVSTSSGEFKFFIGSNTIVKNGESSVFTGAPAVLKYNRVFLPLRVVGETLLRRTVNWNETTQVITIE